MRLNVKRIDFCWWPRLAVVKCGCIDDVDLADKHKFPLSFFPEGKWSRKGYLRTRWKLLTPSHEAAFQIFDLVNVHLFHDASNLKSVEKTPSIYVNFRERALVHTLDRVQNTLGSHELPPRAPLFIFGDFNFRLEGKSVVRKLTGDKMGASPPDAAQVGHFFAFFNNLKASMKEYQSLFFHKFIIWGKGKKGLCVF